jgi:glycosyltransferase involved in cell wall biosynthesis
MQKTILIITDNLPEQINGVVTTYKNIEALAVLDGYRVVYLTPLEFLHVSSPGYREIKISIPWKIGKKIRAVAPDYIHIATEGPLGLYARFYLNQRNRRYNTAYHTKFPEGLKKIAGIPEPWTWSYVRWFHKHSGKVLTTTDSMVTELHEHGFDGDIISWTRGVDRTVFNPEHRGNTVVNGPILLYVGRVSREKNLDDFCDLQFTNANKIIVGDGPYRTELEQRYPDINFVGYKTGADLARYYAMADVFVFPSKWETFGLVMIEAMACGTPVAAYPVQGPVDVIDEGVTGCMNDDLKQAVTDCLFLPRHKVWSGSHRWSWENAWHIFRDNLTPNGKWTDEDGYV